MTYAPDATSDDGARPEESGTRRSLGCLLEIVETLVLTLVIYLLIHNFIAQPFEVEQDSMYPTILEHEYVLIDKLSPRFSDYDRNVVGGLGDDRTDRILDRDRGARLEAKL